MLQRNRIGSGLLVLLLLLSWSAWSGQAAMMPPPPSFTFQPTAHGTSSAASTPATHNLQASYGKLPLQFEINRGQTAKQVHFLSRGSGYSLFLTPTDAVLSLQTPPSHTHTLTHLRTPLHPSILPSPHPAVLRLHLLNANPHPQIAGADALPGKVNYFIGNDPKKWRTDIATYGKVHYQNVYPGIDLIYYGNQQQLEYDFIVSPGADPSTIRFNVQGAQRVSLNSIGELVLHTPGGDVVQHAPNIYQMVNGQRKIIAGGYVLLPSIHPHTLAFRVGAYDHHLPLVIDPVLVYSTYLGGSGADGGASIAVDSAGNAYVTGSTLSLDFPTQRALQPNFGGDVIGGTETGDAFVTELNPTGTAFIYSTYLGGSMATQLGFSSMAGNVRSQGSRGIAVDASGSAYVTGTTNTTDFPTTPGALQPAIGNGNLTAFVTKLSPDGSSLVYSTYLGGAAGSQSGGIAVDAAGSAYVFGNASPDFPVTPGAFQTTDRHIAAFRSGNAGALWTGAGASLPNDTILSLVVDPTNPNIVYAGTYNNNVYKTTDGGMTWHASSSGLPTKIYDPTSALIVSAIYALAIDPVTPSTLYATTGNGPYKSLDGGATWNPGNTGLNLPLQALVIDPKTPTTLYAAPESALFTDNPGTAKGGTPLYKSLDGGATWNPSSAGLQT
nr:SBBP repeat-containing protein [Armatimonadota bacterium]